MGATVVNPVKARSEVIEWGSINLSGTPTAILWDTFGRCPNGPAKDSIRKELVNRGEL